MIVAQARRVPSVEQRSGEEQEGSGRTRGRRRAQDVLEPASCFVERGARFGQGRGEEMRGQRFGGACHLREGVGARREAVEEVGGIAVQTRGAADLVAGEG